MNNQTVKKAVLPVAGFGTRLLPASKSIPKEMITVVDRPAIDYVVKEAIAAGIDTLVLVNHPAKQAIENYFDRNAELEALLETKKKDKLLNELRDIIPSHIHVVSVRQPKPLGLGHAVLCAQPVIGNEPFAVLLPDVLIDSGDSAVNELGQMIRQYQQTGATQILVEEVDPSRVDQYGIVSLQPEQGAASQVISGMVEKPPVSQAPSNLAIVGRYVFGPEIFTFLQQTAADGSGEIQLTDAMRQMLRAYPMQAYTLQGKTFDCGSKAGYLAAVLHFAAQRAELHAVIKHFIQQYPLD